MVDFKLKNTSSGKGKDRIVFDIGTDYIKMLAASESSGRFLIRAMGSKKISGIPKSEVSGVIRSLAKEANVSSDQVAISVAGPSVIARFISMPRMSDAELKGAVRFEAEKFIPFNINDCVLDYQVLNRSAKDNKMPVLLVVAKRELILDRVKLVEDAGFYVRVIDVDCFAVANAFLKNFTDISSEKTVALLNLGASFTNLAILRGGMVHFARDLGIGANDLGALKTDPSGAGKMALTNFIDEVKMSFSYYENQGGINVDEIYVSGGYSLLTEMDSFFTSSFGTKPNRWDPLKFLNPEAKEQDNTHDFFAVSAGLVLR